MSRRKRINLSIAPEQYESIERIRKAQRFSNVCEVCGAIITAYLNIVESGRHNRRARESNEEYITRMFNELADAEPRPENSVPLARAKWHVTVDDIDRVRHHGAHREHQPTTDDDADE